MAVCTLGYAIPKSFADKVRGSASLTELFSVIYGYGSSLKSFFTEIDEDEVEEIIGSFDSKDVEAMRILLNQTSFGESSYTEGTFEVHTNGIKRYLESIGEGGSSRLAGVIVCGDMQKLSDHIFGVDQETQDRISMLLDVPVNDIYSHYKIEGRYSNPEWSQVIRRELESIMKCYKSASRISGEVWIGCL